MKTQNIRNWYSEPNTRDQPYLLKKIPVINIGSLTQVSMTLPLKPRIKENESHDYDKSAA